MRGPWRSFSRSMAFGLICAMTFGTLPAHAQDCDRVCLEGFMDQLLDAMLAHDASTLPLAAGTRYTENGHACGPVQR